MRDGGRIAAAIDILTALEARPGPVNLALKDWGRAARYAGSTDRAFVSGLVLDTLRKRRSHAWEMGADTVRAAVLGTLRFGWDWPFDRINEACADERGPGTLSVEEIANLCDRTSVQGAPEPIAGDYRDWLDASFERAFGKYRTEELAAEAERAPVDLRVNTLKSTPEAARAALEALDAEPFGPLPTTLRIAAPDASERAAPVEAHPAYLKGWVEIQDAGSQLAAAQAGRIKGRSVLDYCAGGGGKTLALAAMMENTGKLYAYDNDARRMKDIIPRAERAGVTILELRSPLDRDPLGDLVGALETVFVDAPCTGSGTWRRHPDTKWRLTQKLLEQRMREQVQVLDAAATYVQPGGRLIYVTCSLLMEENEDQVRAFLERRPDFRLRRDPVRLSPLKDKTDGFFAAVLVRSKDSK